MKLPLPGDFRRFARRHILKHLLPFLFLEILAALLLFLFGERLFRTKGNNLYMVYYATTLFLPFAVSGFPRKLIDRSYLGRVLEVEIKDAVDSHRKFAPTLESLYRKITVSLLVQPSGRRTPRWVKAFEGASNLPDIPVYRKGDVVFHLYGGNEVILLPETDSPHAVVRCACCGYGNEQSDGNCSQCGHTLLKYADLAPYLPNFPIKDIKEAEV